MNLPTSPEGAIILMWAITLTLGLVVALVVTALLYWIHHEAKIIRDGVSEIWNVGQRTANNTIHIPLLYSTNAVAARILGSAVRVIEGAAAIEQHAQGCPGCPQCLAKG